MESLSEPIRLQNIQSGEVTSCDLNVNYLLAIGSSDKNLRVMEWKRGLGFVDVFYSPLSYHKYAITSVRFSPKGTMLASSSIDGTAVLTDVITGTKIFTMVQYNTSEIRFCEFTFDCTKLITAAIDGLLCFWDTAHHREIRHCRLHEDEYSLRALALSPDSEYLLSVDSGNLLKLWLISDIENKQPHCLFKRKAVEDDVLCCDFSPVKKITGTSAIIKFNYCIVICNAEGLVKIWDVIIKRDPNCEEYFRCDLILLHSLKQGSDILSARFSFCGKYLVSTGLNNLVKLWQVKDGNCLNILYGHKKFATCAAFSKESVLLVTGSIDKTVIVWDLTQNLTLDHELLLPCNVSCHFTHINNFQPDNTRDQKKKYSEFSLLQKLTFSSAINCVQFQKNEILAVAGRDKTVGLWTKQTDKVIYTQKEILKEHEYSINHFDMLPCGSKIISCSMDGVMIFWDLNMSLTYKMKLPNCNGSLRTCKFSPDSKFIAAAGDDQKVFLWGTNNLEFIKIMQQHQNAITALSFTPDGKFLLSTCCDGDMVLQNLREDNSAATTKNAHDLGVTSCDFSSIILSECTDQKSSGVYLLATGGNDCFVKLWEVTVSEIMSLKVLSGHGSTVNSVKFSPNEPFILASCSSDTTVRIWDAKAKYCLHVLSYHTSAVTTCSFSKNSLLFTTGSLDKSVLILNVIEKSCHEPKEPTDNCNKLLENWTTSDLVKWFSDIDCPDIAGEIRTKHINGRKLLSLNENSLTDFFRAVNEKEKKKLQHEILFLKKSLGFPSDILHKTKNVPHKFLCPITHNIMNDPVFCADGYVYDRTALTEWFLGGKLISPITKERLMTTKLLSNTQLKKAISEFFVENRSELLM